MGRAAFAFRDLDEELQSFVDDNSVVHVYQSHSSPPSLRTEALKPKTATSSNLSDSMVLKRYIDHNKAQRRRKLLGGALFVGVALLGSLPMLLMEAHKGEPQSPLELALAAPYKALRVRGEILRPSVNTIGIEAGNAREEAERWVEGPNVGDEDSFDDGETPEARAKDQQTGDDGGAEEEEEKAETAEAKANAANEQGAGLDDARLERLEEVLTGKIVKVLRKREMDGP